jgi:hypothetical protein
MSRISTEVRFNLNLPDSKLTELVGRPPKNRGSREPQDDQWDMEACKAATAWVEDNIGHAIEEYNDGEPTVECI